MNHVPVSRRNAEQAAVQWLRTQATQRDLVQPCNCRTHSPQMHNMCQRYHRVLIVQPPPHTGAKFEAFALADKTVKTFDEGLVPTDAQERGQGVWMNLYAHLCAIHIAGDASIALQDEDLANIKTIFSDIFFHGYLGRTEIRFGATPGTNPGVTLQPQNDRPTTILINPIMDRVFTNSLERLHELLATILHECIHALFLEHSCWQVLGTGYICCTAHESEHGRHFQHIAQAIEKNSRIILGMQLSTNRILRLQAACLRGTENIPSMCDLHAYGL